MNTEAYVALHIGFGDKITFNGHTHPQDQPCREVCKSKDETKKRWRALDTSFR